MRCLKRNQRPFWYCLYVSSTELEDEYGNATGEVEITYSEPVKMLANISAATGQSQTEMFGNLDSYDKVIVTDDLNCPIDEHTVLFVDKEPEFAPVPVPPTPPTPAPDGEDDDDTGNDVQTDEEPRDTDQTEPVEPTGDEPEPEPEPTPEPEPEPEPHGPPLYDYIVKRVAKSLNSVSIAIRKVDVR